MRYLVAELKVILEVLKSGEPKTTVKIWECVRSDEEGGRTAAESFFKDVACLTAILATGDRLAIGIMEAARAHRIRIPEDMAIVGFDDIPAASLVSPQLTTLHQPMAEKGRLAISSLLNEKAPLRLKLPTKLMIRQSTTTMATAETLTPNLFTRVPIGSHLKNQE